MKKKFTFLIAGICTSIAVQAQTNYAYWKFDEPTTTTSPISVADSWGNRYGSFAAATVIHNSNQTSDISYITNTSTNTAISKLVNAIRFRGRENSYVKLPDGLMSGLDNFTVSFYYRQISGSEGGKVFDFGVGNDIASKKHMQFTVQGVDKLIYSVQNGGAEQLIEADVSIVTGHFYHIVITQSGSIVTMYMDGEEVAKKTDITIKPSDFASTTLNYLGKSRYGGVGINCVLDEFKIIGRAITYDEMLELHYTGTLPVSFLDFSAKKQNTGGVLLNWSTASEKENSHFEILRSIDGKSFNNIANIPGSNHSNEVKKYQHTDFNPQAGINYYQLKQVDFNGESSLHPDVLAVSTDFTNNGDLKIFAADNKLKLHANVISKSNFKISLTDMSGRVCAEFHDQAVPGNNSFEYAIGQLVAGVYAVTYQSETEKVTTKIQVVK
jgi:hypothetical protein